MSLPRINQMLPMVAEACGKVAYDRFVREHQPAEASRAWRDLTPIEKGRWEAIALAAVTEYQAQRAAGEVYDRWSDAALREISTVGEDEEG